MIVFITQIKRVDLLKKINAIKFIKLKINPYFKIIKKDFLVNMNLLKKSNTKYRLVTLWMLIKLAKKVIVYRQRDNQYQTIVKRKLNGQVLNKQ